MDDPDNPGIMYLLNEYQEIKTESVFDIVTASINVEPYVLIPSAGEKIGYTYSAPLGSRVIIRVFDLSGRFITTLQDIPPNTQNVGELYWDGKDHLGQILSPGTYLMHIESMNFQTGETTKDMDPVVIGIRP